MKAEWIDFEPTLRDKILSKARYGEITPQQAEAEAAANGLPPLEQKPPLPAFDPLNESHWSLVMAIAWIVWRDIDAVRDQNAEFRKRCTRWVWQRWKAP
jgi:hypothetical protein